MVLREVYAASRDSRFPASRPSREERIIDPWLHHRYVGRCAVLRKYLDPLPRFEIIEPQPFLRVSSLISTVILARCDYDSRDFWLIAWITFDRARKDYFMYTCGSRSYLNGLPWRTVTYTSYVSYKAYWNFINTVMERYRRDCIGNIKKRTIWKCIRIEVTRYLLQTYF